jgi:glycerol-3-phosphate responsive antiterminator
LKKEVDFFYGINGESSVPNFIVGINGFAGVVATTANNNVAARAQAKNVYGLCLYSQT